MKGLTAPDLKPDERRKSPCEFDSHSLRYTMVMDVPSKYLSFEDNPLLAKGKKTKVVLVISKAHDDVLGEIRWYEPWRQYTFQPYAVTIWNNRCLEDVQTCLTTLMDERKKSELDK